MSSFADDVLYMGLTEGPDRHAVADTFGDWTWRELHEQVLKMEAYLRSLDIPQLSRVVLVGPDSVWHHIMLLACARAEMIFVPVNNRYTPADADHVMRLIKPQSVFSTRISCRSLRTPATTPPEREWGRSTWSPGTSAK